MTPYYFALLAAVLWGTATTMEKIALSQISPLMGLFIRSVAITIFITMTLGFKKELNTLPHLPVKGVILFIISGIVSAFLGQYFYFYAMQKAPASKVVPVAGTYPLFAALFAIIFLGERLTITNAIGIILIIAGLALVRS